MVVPDPEPGVVLPSAGGAEPVLSVKPVASVPVGGNVVLFEPPSFQLINIVIKVRKIFITVTSWTAGRHARIYTCTNGRIKYGALVRWCTARAFLRVKEK